MAQLIGHAYVGTTLNVCTQVLDGSEREVVERVGDALNVIERNVVGAALMTPIA
jgi:hypothetical protein